MQRKKPFVNQEKAFDATRIFCYHIRYIYYKGASDYASI